MNLRSIKSDDTSFLGIKNVWCKDLAFAVDYLHTHNQVHLKIYPQNIFIKNDHLVLGEIGFKTQLIHYQESTESNYYSKDEGFSLEFDIRF